MAHISVGLFSIHYTDYKGHELKEGDILFLNGQYHLVRKYDEHRLGIKTDTLRPLSEDILSNALKVLFPCDQHNELLSKLENGPVSTNELAV